MSNSGLQQATDDDKKRVPNLINKKGFDYVVNQELKLQPGNNGEHLATLVKLTLIFPLTELSK